MKLLINSHTSTVPHLKLGNGLVLSIKHIIMWSNNVSMLKSKLFHVRKRSPRNLHKCKPKETLKIAVREEWLEGVSIAHYPRNCCLKKTERFQIAWNSVLPMGNSYNQREFCIISYLWGFPELREHSAYKQPIYKDLKCDEQSMVRRNIWWIACYLIKYMRSILHYSPIASVYEPLRS